jgi:tetratricopeptide (TPR) repeat protein
LLLKVAYGVTGARGSKKRGLETLERVTREGKWARDDARIVLIALYKREGRFTDAIGVTRDLANRYPRNYLFKLEMADALASQASVERKANRITEAQKLEREAFNTFDALLHDRSTRDSAARLLDLIHFQYGEALVIAGQPEAAAKEYLAASIVPGADAGLATMARLRAAQSFDLAGKRNDALAQYRAVLERPNIFDAHDEAKHGLREPYKLKNTGKNISE